MRRKGKKRKIGKGRRRFKTRPSGILVEFNTDEFRLALVRSLQKQIFIDFEFVNHFNGNDRESKMVDYLLRKGTTFGFSMGDFDDYKFGNSLLCRLKGIPVAKLRPFYQNYIDSQRQNVSKDNIIKAIVSKFQGEKTGHEKRLLESSFIRDTNITEIFETLCDISVPKDILVSIFTCFGYGADLLFNVGKVSKNFYLAILSSWKGPVTISTQTIFQISCLVMGQMKIMRPTKRLTIQEHSYLWGKCGKFSLREIDFSSLAITTIKDFCTRIKKNRKKIVSVEKILFASSIKGQGVWKPRGKKNPEILGEIFPNLRICISPPSLKHISDNAKLEVLVCERVYNTKPKRWKKYFKKKWKNLKSLSCHSSSFGNRRKDDLKMAMSSASELENLSIQMSSQFDLEFLSSHKLTKLSFKYMGGIYRNARSGVPNDFFIPVVTGNLMTNKEKMESFPVLVNLSELSLHVGCRFGSYSQNTTVGDGDNPLVDPEFYEIRFPSLKSLKLRMKVIKKDEIVNLMNMRNIEKVEIITNQFEDAIMFRIDRKLKMFFTWFVTVRDSYYRRKRHEYEYEDDEEEEEVFEEEEMGEDDQEEEDMDEAMGLARMLGMIQKLLTRKQKRNKGKKKRIDLGIVHHERQLIKSVIEEIAVEDEDVLGCALRTNEIKKSEFGKWLGDDFVFKDKLEEKRAGNNYFEHLIRRYKKSTLHEKVTWKWMYFEVVPQLEVYLDVF